MAVKKKVVKKIVRKKIAKKKITKTKLGSYAGITFTVSRKKIITFNELKRDDSYNWTDHEVLNGQPLSEYGGAGLSTLTFQIELRKSFGIAPYTTLKKLRLFAAAGKTSAFMLGKTVIGNTRFRVESIGQAMEEISPKGEVLKITVDITLKQYNKTAVKKAKISKPKSKKTAKKKSSSKSKQKSTGTITVKVGMLNARMSPSLKGKIKKVLRKNQKLKVYGTKKTDITWYKLAGGLYCSAGKSYVNYKKN